MYHGFCAQRRDDDPENLFVEVDRFEQQLRWLLDQGWAALDLDGYLAALADPAQRPRRSFLVTIDDGFTSVLHLAVPVLERLGVPALLYVPSDLTGAPPPGCRGPATSRCSTPTSCGTCTRCPWSSWACTAPTTATCAAWAPPCSTTRSAARTDASPTWSASPLRSFAYPFGAHDAAARDAVAGGRLRGRPSRSSTTPAPTR